MKKILLTLPILAFPLIAQAADKPTQAPEAMIQATERKFLPKYCAEGVKGLATEVYNCYLEIQSSNPEQEKCLIADYMVLKLIQLNNDRSIALGQPVKYDMPFFILVEAEKRASRFIKENTKFKDYTMPEFGKYLANSFHIMSKDYIKLNKKTNGNCSAFFKP